MYGGYRPVQCYNVIRVTLKTWEWPGDGPVYAVCMYVCTGMYMYVCMYVYIDIDVWKWSSRARHDGSSAHIAKSLLLPTVSFFLRTREDEMGQRSSTSKTTGHQG